MANYHIVSCHVLWREFCYFAARSRNVFDFTFLKQGLHNTPDLLRSELQKAVDNANPESSAVLIGYGLCSNGIVGIEARDKPLVIVRAHDCITFLLGSKERYREYFDANPGTYWYSPGWVDTTLQPGQKRHELTLKLYTEKYGEDNALYIMEQEQAWYKAYSNAAYVDLDFDDSTHYKEFTKKSADWLGWNYDELKGDDRLITQLIEGNWDSEDFMVVEPGERITASYDAKIISKTSSETKAS